MKNIPVGDIKPKDDENYVQVIDPPSSSNVPQDGCKENRPLAHLLWILVFDDQHNQIRLMNLQVFIL